MTTKQLLSLSFATCVLHLLSACCGYQMGQGEGLSARYQTINVPYVEGDQDGALTSAIIQHVVRSGAFEYQNSNANLELIVKEIDLDYENIGFRYYRKKHGQLKHEIIPTETRAIEVVEISVIDNNTGCTVLGPALITASVDFDHDYYYSRDSVNVFSLGQLIDIDSAYDGVQTPLNNLLAQKIVDYISQSW